MPPRSLAAFLQTARAALTAPAGQRPTPLPFVVGNESADLDSLCSAVLLAYFRSHGQPGSGGGALHVPLSNLPRADLALRPELQAALAGSGCGPERLLTLSELPGEAGLAAADTQWLLVDHNVLTGELARRFAGRVRGCVDHHADEGGDAVGGVPLDGSPRTIAACGSCASLVLDDAATRAVWRRLAAEQPDPATDRALARLALAPILVDTGCLTFASKTTAADRRAVALAESFLLARDDDDDGGGGGDPAYDRAAYFAELSRRKNDISQMPYADILRKDYKQWTEGDVDAGSSLTLGMSSVVQGFDYLLAHIGDRDHLLAALRTHARARALDLAAVMTVQAHDDDGSLSRELLLWAFTPRAAAAAQAFVRDHAATLGLASWRDGRLDDLDDLDDRGASGRGEWRACWTQSRIEFSRKQVAPFLREAMQAALQG